MTIITNNEVIEVSEVAPAVNNSINNHNNEDKQKPKKTLTIQERTTGQRMMIRAEEVLIAAGRGPNTDILHPERAGIKTDEKGWIVVNEYLETSQAQTSGLLVMQTVHIYLNTRQTTKPNLYIIMLS